MAEMYTFFAQDPQIGWNGAKPNAEMYTLNKGFMGMSESH